MIVSDKEKLIQLLASWGVPYGIGYYEKPRDGATMYIQVGDGHDLSIPLSDKVDGYGGFYTSFEFDDDGAFVRMGAWE